MLLRDRVPRTTGRVHRLRPKVGFVRPKNDFWGHETLESLLESPPLPSLRTSSSLYLSSVLTQVLVSSQRDTVLRFGRGDSVLGWASVAVCCKDRSTCEVEKRHSGLDFSKIRHTKVVVLSVKGKER